MSQVEANTASPTQLEIDICTTYFAHDMKSTIFKRLGLLFAFGQFLLGSAIMTRLFDPMTLGFVIALIGALQATVKPANEEAASRVFKLELQELLSKIHGNGQNSELFWSVDSEFKAVSKKEPHASQTVLMVAQQCCHMHLGIKQRLHLNWWQKFIAVFSGATQVFTRN